MNRSQKNSSYLSALAASVAVSAMFAPLAASAGATTAGLKNNSKETTKTKNVTKAIAANPSKAAPYKKVAMVATNEKLIKTAKVAVVKPTKTDQAMQKATPKTNTTPKVKATKPNTEKVAIIKPPVSTTTANVIPVSAVNIWEENARQKCYSWGAKFENDGFNEVPQAQDAIKAIENIFDRGKNAFISGDFNGDGKKDYIIITPDGGCKTGGNTSYGKVGPPNLFLLSNDKGYSIASGFNAWTNPSFINHSGNNDTIEIKDSFDGKCGQIAKISWGWDGEKIAIIDRRNKEGQLVNQEGCLILPPASINALQMGNSVKKAEFPPITPGFYAYSVTCTNAISESRRDRPSKFIGMFNSKVWGYFYDDGIAWNNIRLESMELVSENQFRLHLRYLGSTNSAETKEAMMKILGNDRFSITLKGYTTTYSLCQDNMVPNWLKAQFVN